GIPFNVSEITITAHHALGNGNEFQKLVAEKLYRLWFSHSASNGIIWWNLVDGTAYVPKDRGDGENQYRGGLLNHDFSEKPAFSALYNLIKKEWNTRINMTYVEGAENRFHGFYGDYEAVIKTNQGTFTRKFKLSKNDSNKFNLEIM
ncbi:MAG: glycoside hydrolase family 10, partial [Lentisphaerota bacterium]